MKLSATMRRSRPAYTLMEIILVMTILIILGAVAIPSFDGMSGDTKVRGAGDDVRSAWAQARARAIETGLPHRFAAQDGAGKFRVAPDSDEYWDTGTGVEESDNGKVLVGSLPDGIVFNVIGTANASTQSSLGWDKIVTFLPDGTCKEDARVELNENGSTLVVVVKVRGLTGEVSVLTKRQEEEGR
jgi:Tfp pilus assembly protein FimT